MSTPYLCTADAKSFDSIQAAASHENTAHDGAQTCWPAEITNDDPRDWDILECPDCTPISMCFDCVADVTFERMQEARLA